MFWVGVYERPVPIVKVLLPLLTVLLVVEVVRYRSPGMRVCQEES
jgi:hypothetical protein